MSDQPIDDPIDVGTAARLLDPERLRPVACCPRCRGDVPLVSTFERTGAEFACVECGGWFGWLAPKAVDPTPELLAKVTENNARFEAGRGSRAASDG